MPPFRSCWICSASPPIRFNSFSRPAWSMRASARWSPRCIPSPSHCSAPARSAARCASTSAAWCYLLITAVLTASVICGTRAVFAGLLRPVYTRDKVLAGMNLLHQPAAATVYRNAPSDPAVPDARPTLARLRQRGMLRVGFIPDALPFAFFNSRGDLVGFDIELAHHLASELSVRLEFVPIDRGRMEEQLGGGYCDIVMSGVAVTTLRAATLLFSNSYLDETFALVVPDYAREQFSSWRAIEARPATTIAVPNVSYYIDKLRARLPRARLKVIEDLGAAFAQPDTTVD